MKHSRCERIMCTFTNTLFMKVCLHIYKHYLHSTAKIHLNPHYACCIIYSILYIAYTLYIVIKYYSTYVCFYSRVRMHKECYIQQTSAQLAKRANMSEKIFNLGTKKAKIAADIESVGKIARRRSQKHGLINYTNTKAFLKNYPAGKFSVINLPSQQTKVYVADRTLLLRGVGKVLQIIEKDLFTFSLKLNIYQILYMFVYLVLNLY